MAKKVNNKKVQLTLDGLKSGMIVKNHHNEDVEITDDLIEQMRRFEQETNKSVIWRNRITGTFLYYKYFEDNPEEKNIPKKKSGKKPKAKDLDEEIESGANSEENLMLNAIEDYKAKYGVSKLNTNTKKFKAFFEEWKQSE